MTEHSHSTQRDRLEMNLLEIDRLEMDRLEMDCLEIDLPAAPEQVGPARRAVAEFLRRRAWGEDDSDALLLAVGEACNNAVNYGGGGRPGPRFHVHCRTLAGGRLQVDVRNQGNGFHPDLGDYGRLPDNEFATHGRGFGLMLALVDSVQVLAEGGSTVVRLTKARSA